MFGNPFSSNESKDSNEHKLNSEPPSTTGGGIVSGVFSQLGNTISLKEIGRTIRRTVKGKNGKNGKGKDGKGKKGKKGKKDKKGKGGVEIGESKVSDEDGNNERILLSEGEVVNMGEFSDDEGDESDEEGSDVGVSAIGDECDSMSLFDPLGVSDEYGWRLRMELYYSACRYTFTNMPLEDCLRSTIAHMPNQTPELGSLLMTYRELVLKTFSVELNVFEALSPMNPDNNVIDLSKALYSPSEWRRDWLKINSAGKKVMNKAGQSFVQMPIEVIKSVVDYRLGCINKRIVELELLDDWNPNSDFFERVHNMIISPHIREKSFLSVNDVMEYAASVTESLEAIIARTNSLENIDRMASLFRQLNNPMMMVFIGEQNWVKWLNQSPFKAYVGLYNVLWELTDRTKLASFIRNGQHHLSQPQNAIDSSFYTFRRIMEESVASVMNEGGQITQDSLVSILSKMIELIEARTQFILEEITQITNPTTSL